MNTPEKPLCILTGATGGIGRALADSLARRTDITLVLACRDTARAEALRTELQSIPGASAERIVSMELDLARFDSVERFCDEIKAWGVPVRAIINNAGTMPGRMTLTADGYESATQINFLAPAMLTAKLIPQLAEGASIVFTTSLTRRIVRLHPDWESRSRNHHSRFITYGRSKLMLTHFALSLSEELKERHIRVSCTDPGIADTGIITLGHKAIDWLSDKLFRPLIHTASQGAAPTLRALDDPDANGRIFTLGGSHPIPTRFLRHRLHQAVIQAPRINNI